METIYQILRTIHIAAGITAFFVAPVALAVKKGGRAHARWGSTFFWGMVGVAASAVPLTLIRPNVFLSLVAVFSFHLSLSGYRAVARRKTSNLTFSRKVDLFLAAGMILFYLALAGWGIHLFTLRPHHPFGYISLVFSAIGMRFSVREIYDALTPAADQMAWWYKHMQGMVGSYIGAVSALSAVNFFFLPDVVRWLWPTLIGAPLLALWERRYKKKFNHRVAKLA